MSREIRDIRFLIHLHITHQNTVLSEAFGAQEILRANFYMLLNLFKTLRNRSCSLPDINRGEFLSGWGDRKEGVWEGDGGKEPGHIDLSSEGMDGPEHGAQYFLGPFRHSTSPQDLENDGGSTFLNPEAKASSFTGLAFDREISRVLRGEE